MNENMIEKIKNEKPIIKFFVLGSLFIMGIIIIFTPMIVMEKLIVTKFLLTMPIYLIIRTLQILYIIAIFIFGAYGGYSYIKKLYYDGQN